MSDNNININNMDKYEGWNSAAFAIRLKEVISGTSGFQFAKRCGFAEGMLRKYLSGESVPGADKLVSIARVADVNLSWLALGEGSKEGGAEESGITTVQLAIVLEFERYARRKPDSSARDAIQGFVEEYNEGLLETGKIGDVPRITEDELMLWRDIAWQRRTSKASIEEGILCTAIEIVDEFLVSSGQTMASDKKAHLIVAIYRLNATSEGVVDRAMLVKLMMSLIG